jgi:DNA-binding transcriptional ArsR family regulator
MNSDERLGLTFSALADPTRRAILARLEKTSNLTIGEIAEPLSIKLPAVLKHLRILQEVGLVSRDKQGRTVHVSLRPTPLREALAWLVRHERFWGPRLDRLATAAEAKEKKLRGIES